jgi:hypothetical protein
MRRASQIRQQQPKQGTDTNSFIKSLYCFHKKYFFFNSISCFLFSHSGALVQPLNLNAGGINAGKRG